MQQCKCASIQLCNRARVQGGMRRLRWIVLLWLLLALPARADTVHLPLVAAPMLDVPVTWATVTYIVDGDTFDVDFDGDGLTDDRVRPIGIDTPERGECYYSLAKARAKELLLGRRVALQRDVSERDRSDRLLRYVYLGDGTFLNARMVREGFAWAGCWSPDCRYLTYLEAMQTLAQGEGAGGWAVCAWDLGGDVTPQPSPTATSAPTATPSPSQTPTLTPTASAGPCSCTGNLYNCADFTYQWQAQACYDHCMSQVGYDIHNLDGSDDDGRACESLP